MKPIVAYYRASKSEQRNSIEVQRDQMRDFVKNNSNLYCLVAEYAEYHTGKGLNLQKLLNNVLKKIVFLLLQRLTGYLAWPLIYYK